MVVGSPGIVADTSYLGFAARKPDSVVSTFSNTRSDVPFSRIPVPAGGKDKTNSRTSAAR